jgi:hypothetical protein
VGGIAPVGASAFSSPDPHQYQLHLSPGGAVAVRAECNWRVATIDAASGRLSFAPALGSPQRCDGASEGGRFLQLLGSATAFEIDHRGHLLVSTEDGGVLEFRPGPVDRNPSVLEAQ